MPRLIPAAVDILLIATLLAGLRRAGDFDFATEHVPSHALRWLVLQFLFLGERFLDLLLAIVRKYPLYFRPRPAIAPSPSVSPRTSAVEPRPPRLSITHSPQQQQIYEVTPQALTYPAAPAAQPYELSAADLRYMHMQAQGTTMAVAVDARGRRVQSWNGSGYAPAPPAKGQIGMLSHGMALGHPPTRS